MNIGNAFMRAIALSPLHFLLGAGIAVIDVRGRKSGRTYSTPVNVVSDHRSYIVTSLRSRTWWRNLRGDQPAILTASGKRHNVRGQVIEDEAAVTAVLSDYFRAHPTYARYFRVKLAANGEPDTADIANAARERVVIRLYPI